MPSSMEAGLAGSVSVSVVAVLFPAEAAASVSTGASVATGVSTVLAGLVTSVADGIAANSA